MDSIWILAGTAFFVAAQGLICFFGNLRVED